MVHSKSSIRKIELKKFHNINNNNMIHPSNSSVKKEKSYSTRKRSEESRGALPLLSSKNRYGNKGMNKHLCECQKHAITEYCRTCRKFICHDCKTNSSKHKNHLTIRLNLDNLENNINLYGNLIQTDIKNIMELNKQVLKNNIERIGMEELEKNKEEINTKYKEVITNYSNIMKKIRKFLDKENEGRVKLLVGAYNSSSVKIHKEIYDLIENLKVKYNDKGHNEIKMADLEYYLGEINKKEGTLAVFKRDIIKYHLTNEINSNLKNSFDRINQILDEIINDENPFNLDSKFYPDLAKMNIIEQPNDQESSQDENDIK